MGQEVQILVSVHKEQEESQELRQLSAEVSQVMHFLEHSII